MILLSSSLLASLFLFFVFILKSHNHYQHASLVRSFRLLLLLYQVVSMHNPLLVNDNLHVKNIIFILNARIGLHAHLYVFLVLSLEQI